METQTCTTYFQPAPLQFPPMGCGALCLKTPQRLGPAQRSLALNLRTVMKYLSRSSATTNLHRFAGKLGRTPRVHTEHAIYNCSACTSGLRASPGCQHMGPVASRARGHARCCLCPQRGFHALGKFYRPCCAPSHRGIVIPEATLETYDSQFSVIPGELPWFSVISGELPWFSVI